MSNQKFEQNVPLSRGGGNEKSRFKVNETTFNEEVKILFI